MTDLISDQISTSEYKFYKNKQKINGRDCTVLFEKIIVFQGVHLIN